MKRIAEIVEAALFTASGTLYAAPAEDLIGSLDSDLHGQLSLDEVDADPALEANFQLLDVDQDRLSDSIGTLSSAIVSSG